MTFSSVLLRTYRFSCRLQSLPSYFLSRAISSSPVHMRWLPVHWEWAPLTASTFISTSFSQGWYSNLTPFLFYPLPRLFIFIINIIMILAAQIGMGGKDLTKRAQRFVYSGVSGSDNCVWSFSYLENTVVWSRILSVPWCWKSIGLGKL